MHIRYEHSCVQEEKGKVRTPKPRGCSQASKSGLPYFLEEAAAFLALSVVPNVRESFDRICGDGIALPLSYSWMTCGFSLIICASCACVSFFARRAAMICFFSSLGTLHQAAHASQVTA